MPADEVSLPALSEAWRLSRRGAPVAALDLARQIHADSRTRGDDNVRLLAAHRLAWFCPMNARYDEGYEFAAEAVSGWQARGEHSREAKARSAGAFALSLMGDDGALDEAVAAEALVRSSDDRCALASTSSTLAIVLTTAKQFEEAASYARTSIEHGREAGDAVALGRWLNNLAYVLCTPILPERRADEATMRPALAGFEEGLALATRTGDGWCARLCLNNLVECMTDLHDFDAAQSYIDRLARLGGDVDPRSLSHELFALGHLDAARNRPAESLAALSLSLEIARGTGDTEMAAQACQQIANGHARAGNWREAYEAHREFHDFSMRQAAESSQRRARLAVLRIETERFRAMAEQERIRAQDLEQDNRALAIESERLMRASMEDSLTGLMNRRRLGLAFLDLVATREPFAVAVLDIDHFKSVNDRFTHIAGDAVLEGIAALLRRHLRPHDLPIRYGGEEFVVLFVNAGLDEARSTCRRLRLAIARLAWPDLDPGLRVTVSIGLASSTEASTPDDVLALADRRLFTSKQRGRNRVTTC